MERDGTPRLVRWFAGLRSVQDDSYEIYLTVVEGFLKRCEPNLLAARYGKTHQSSYPIPFNMGTQGLSSPILGRTRRPKGELLAMI